MPTIGYLHTGIEKTAEQKKWQQVVPLVERMDYLAAQSNSLAYVLAVEKLLGLTMPKRVDDIRVPPRGTPAPRESPDLAWHARDGNRRGVDVVLCVRERELLLNINELIAGFRFFPSYFRVGGLREDLPRGFHEPSTRSSIASPARSTSSKGLLTKNDIFRRRTEGRRRAHARGCLSVGTGRPDRSRVRLGLRRPQVLPVLRLRVLRLQDSDRHRRRRLRAVPRARGEMRESVKICRQAIQRISPTGAWACDDTRVVPPPEGQGLHRDGSADSALPHILAGFTVPAGDAYVPVEGPRGEHGCYIVSDGSNRPWRVKMRRPSFMAIQALPSIVKAASSPMWWRSSVQ
jgi:NADH-quinone oxidoreductase subunit D